MVVFFSFGFQWFFLVFLVNFTLLSLLILLSLARVSATLSKLFLSSPGSFIPLISLKRGYFGLCGYCDRSWFLWKLFLFAYDNCLRLFNFRFWSNVDTLIFGITTDLKLSLHLQCKKTLSKHRRSAKNINNFG